MKENNQTKRDGQTVAPIIGAMALLALAAYFFRNTLRQPTATGAWWEPYANFVLVAAPVVAGVLLAAIAFRGQSPNAGRLGRSGLVTGLAVGAVGFAIGFVAPMFLSNSNFGPLFSLITGPAGFLVGSCIGIARCAFQGHCSAVETSPQ